MSFFRTFQKCWFLILLLFAIILLFGCSEEKPAAVSEVEKAILTAKDLEIALDNCIIRDYELLYQYEELIQERGME